MSSIPSLADLAPDALLTEGEAAEYLRVRPTALRTMRLRGRGPASLHVGRAVRYTCEAVRAFLADQGSGRSFRAPTFGTPFEPHLHDLACGDEHPFSPVHFASACPLAAAVDAVMVEAATDWLRATPADLFAVLWTWGRSERDAWPGDAGTLSDALVAPTGRLASDLRRLGLAANRCETARGPGIDLLRVAQPSRAARFPGSSVSA